MSTHIFEFIVLRQTADDEPTIRRALQEYDTTAREVEGFIQSRHFQSFYALPQPDDQPVYIMIYQWASKGVIPMARDHIVGSPALSGLLSISEIVAFALTEQTAGEPLNLSTVISSAEQVLETAVRRIKPDYIREFEQLRQEFVAYLDEQPSVLGSYEFRAVLGQNPEGLTVGLSVYQNQATFNQLSQQLMGQESTTQYFATFVPEALKYAHALSE